MSSSERLEKVCQLLSDRYGHLGRTAAKRLREWLLGEIPYAYPDIIEKHLEEKHIDLLFDAFWQVLPFGTGGRRGPVGYGPNRINPTTVAMVVQGHCQYLRAAYPNQSDLIVVVANDVRIFNDLAGVYRFLANNHPLLGLSSRSLGRLACEIYAGNGIIAYFPEPKSDHGVMSTPEMAYLVRQLQAVGGIQLSASHNPPDDNGIKIYDSFGSQPVAPNDEKLTATMDNALDIRTTSFEKGLEHGTIREFPKKFHNDYIETYVTLYNNIYTPEPGMPIVYTPLNGCGRSTVGELLERLGYHLLIPPGHGPDGTFSAIPLKAPNPEVSQATGPAKAFADEISCGIVLSSDPDVDRVGLDVKLADGTWYHFDGNQIATVLCYFLMLDRNGPQRRGLVIETFVTTKILGEIVGKVEESLIIDDLPVGMKYVANVLNELERDGLYNGVSCSPEDLVFAAEESHGVMLAPTIREKDAAPACMYLAALYQRLRREGRTLLDYYMEILKELGAYDTVNRSIMMRGVQGMQDKETIMASLRKTPPKIFAGQKVRSVVDLLDEKKFGPFKGHTDRLSRDAMQIFTDAFIIAVRPSGTEPKLKLYCHLLPHKENFPLQGMKSLSTLRETANTIAQLAYNDLLARIGLNLGKAGLLLADIVDLDRKLHFEQQTGPRLRDFLAKGSFTTLHGLFQWLRVETAAMTPGADPLPAVKEAIAYLCDQWIEEIDPTPLLADLKKWAIR